MITCADNLSTLSHPVIKLNNNTLETRGVSPHYGLAIYINKYLKAKEELWKLKYSRSKNIIFKKIF
jgi:hypothetical protein